MSFNAYVRGRPTERGTWQNSYRTTVTRAREAGAIRLVKGPREIEYDEVDKVFADGGWQLMQWDGGHIGVLNEDDYDFILRVRETGSASCEMWSPQSHRSPMDEIEFWLHPWCSEDTGVPKQNWQPSYARKLREEQDQRALDLYKANRAQREIEREIEARTMERENKQYIKEQARIAEERERRIVRTMLADIEWEKAQPKGGKDNDADTVRGRGVRIKSSRFYVPYWLREEIAIDAAWEPAHEENEWFDRKAARKATRLAKKIAAKQDAEVRKWHDARAHVDSRNWAFEIERKRIEKEAHEREQAERAQAEREQAERAAIAQRQRQWAERAAWEGQQRERREALADAERAAAEQDQMFEQHRRDEAERQRQLNRKALKDRILSYIRGTGTMKWTVPMLMRATNASEEEVISCASELAGAGYIHQGR